MIASRTFAGVDSEPETQSRPRPVTALTATMTAAATSVLNAAILAARCGSARAHEIAMNTIPAAAGQLDGGGERADGDAEQRSPLQRAA